MFNLHRKRWNQGGDTEGEMLLNEAIEEFDFIVDNKANPTVHSIQYTIPSEINIDNKLNTNVIISDVTRNKGDASDLKLLHTKLSTQLDSGSYVWFSDDVWIVGNEEINSVESHRTYVIRKCMSSIKVLYNDKIYSYPIALNNLTADTDGLNNSVDIGVEDGRRKVYISKNEITSIIDVDYRMMIGNKTIYKTTSVDDFTNEGVYTLVVLQTVFNSKDDKERNLAYNEEFKEVFNKIKGNDYIYPGTTNLYTCVGALSWTVAESYAKTAVTNAGCNITCIGDKELIGKYITLTVNASGTKITKKILIKGVF